MCVRSWVFAGKVSPQFVQLAYKVPVSGSRDRQLIESALMRSERVEGKRKEKNVQQNSSGLLRKGHRRSVDTTSVSAVI